MSACDRGPNRQVGTGAIFSIIFVLGFVLFLGYMLLPSVHRDISKLPVWRCKDNLKHIGIALHLYHDKYGSFPPAYVADEQGTPIHSWRVLILPFLAEAESTRIAETAKVYETYRFDQPWDGRTNRQLADQVLDVYRCPSAKNGTAHYTSYLAVVGSETAWPGRSAISIRDIRDGSSTTLLCVEVDGSRIRWTQPDDLQFDQLSFLINSSAGGIGSPHEGGVNVLCGDGTVRFVSENVKPTTIRSLLTIAGHELIGEDEF